MRLAIVVEGRTEEEFVNGLLQNMLRMRGIHTTPILLEGNVTIGRLGSNMARLFWSFESVTSFVDYYGFRNRGNESRRSLQCKIDEFVRKKISRKFDESRVFSYIQKYEFEALLFSNTKVVDRLFDDLGQYGIQLHRVRSKFATPEDINDDPEKTPSKRLMRVLPRYRKVLHGPLIAMETGLDDIRCECPRFDAWVSRLESLGYSN